MNRDSRLYSKKSTHIPLPVTAPEPLTKLSSASKYNPGHRFPRRLFWTTPPDVTIDTIHDQPERLPLNWIGATRLADWPDPRVPFLARLTPRTDPNGPPPWYDRALARHQARCLLYHLDAMRERLNLLARGKTHRPLFVDDFEYGLFLDNRNHELVDAKWREHIAEQVEAADWYEHDSAYALDGMVEQQDVPRKGYANAVASRLRARKRIAALPGQKRKKGKKGGRGYTREPPPMLVELMARFELGRDTPTGNVPLVADFRRWIIPNWKKPDADNIPTLAVMTPHADDLLPSVLNHYALYIRATTSLYNEHMRYLVAEAHEHRFTFPKRDHKSRRHDPTGGVIGATRTKGYQSPLFLDFARSLAHLAHDPTDRHLVGDTAQHETEDVFDVGLFASTWNALLKAHHPIVGAYNDQMKFDARDVAERADERFMPPDAVPVGANETARKHGVSVDDDPRYAREWSLTTDLAERFAEHQRRPLYRHIEREIVRRYHALALSVGIAPPVTPLTSLLPLAEPYERESITYRTAYRTQLRERPQPQAHPADPWRERFARAYPNVDRRAPDDKG